MQHLKDFANDEGWFKAVRTPRPLSLRYQTEWVLCRLASCPAFPGEARGAVPASNRTRPGAYRGSDAADRT